MISGLGKRTICFEMTKVRPFKDLKKKMNMTREDTEICKITLNLVYCCNLCNRSGSLVCPPAQHHAFSMDQFGQNFNFFIVCYFLEKFDQIEEKTPKHQTSSKYS